MRENLKNWIEEKELLFSGRSQISGGYAKIYEMKLKQISTSIYEVSYKLETGIEDEEGKTKEVSENTIRVRIVGNKIEPVKIRD